MQADRQGFGQSGLGQAQVIGNRVGLVALDDQLFAERALDVGKRHGAAVKTHVQAVVVLTRLAKAAVGARARGRNGNALAHRQASHLRAQCLNDARHLMAQCNGLFDAHRAKTAVLGVMQIRAANAAIGHLHLNLMGLWRRQFARFQAQIPGAVAND